MLPSPSRHLDPFGTSVNYLDAAFRNVRNLGIVSVTSTDTSSLYAKTVHVAKRHYGCNIIRTEYYKELAARVVLSAIARLVVRASVLCGRLGTRLIQYIY